MMQLTKKDMLLLIKEVKNRPCLWDGSHDNYNIGMAWLEISQQMDVPVNILKIKWKNLRDTFIRRQKARHLTGKVKYKSSSSYIDRLEFLTAASGNHYDDNDSDTSDDYNIKSENVNKNEEDEKSEVNDSDDGDSPEVDLKFVTCEYKAEPTSEENFGKPDAEVNNSWRSDTTDDIHELMFLKSLVPFFCKLEPMRKLVLRSRIQDMLLNEVTAQQSLSQPS